MPPKNILLSATLLFVSSLLFSQERARKWGDIPESDLKMTIYPNDSTASAVVLQDVGKIVLRANTGAVTLYRSRRIKILDPSALEKGNLSITYRDRKGEDELRDLDVQVTTPDGIKKKVKSDNVFTEKLQRGWAAKKIFIPDLMKGCVIEYRYQMQSNNYFSLYDWYFQEEIPVRWSEVEATIPEYYDFVFLRNIAGAFDLQESSQGSDPDGHVCYTNKWGVANNPALKLDRFTTSPEDHLTSVKFQLRTVIIPGRAPETVMSTWKELAKDLEDYENFGLQYKKSGNFENLWTAFQPALSADDTPEKKMAKALRFVSANMKWDGNYRFSSYDDLDDAFKKKTGSSADLNLTLVALLRKAGLKVTPLLLSTRSNGRMYPEYPFLTQFNAVMALVQHDEKISLLDATNPYLPVNLLNLEFYRGAAWMVDKDAPEWVDISAPESSQTWYGKLKLEESGEVSGNFTMQITGNFAAKFREDIHEMKPDALLQKNFGSSESGIQFDSIEFAQVEALDQPLSVKFRCTASSAATVVNDFIYCKPVLDFYMLESPFKALERNFPVEFPHPFKAQYVVDLVLPPGYALEELPQAARANLPDNAGKMSFNCSKNANGALQLILKMNLAQTEFSPEQYAALRQFFELVVDKTQLQLVLKKT